MTKRAATLLIVAIGASIFFIWAYIILFAVLIWTGNT